jgi:hypothetical protein
MGRFLHHGAAALVMLLVAGAAIAAEVGGVKLDDKISLGGQELVLMCPRRPQTRRRCWRKARGESS